MDENEKKILRERKILHKLLDDDDVHGTFFKTTTNNIAEEKKDSFKDIYLDSLFIISKLYINDNLNERFVAYYTQKIVAQEMLFNNSHFRLNAIDYSNDPTEGKTFLDYLFGKNNYLQRKITNTGHGAFAGCFTFNYDSLNQFRLYGKEDGKEGTGLSLIFIPSFFSKGEKIPNIYIVRKSSFFNENKPLQNEVFERNRCALFRCIYIDPETRQVETVGQKDTYLFFHDKNIEKEIHDVEDKIVQYQEFIANIIKVIKKEMEKLKKDIKELDLDEDEKVVVGQLLINLRYLIKHVAFKEEQECRIIKIHPLNDKEKIHIDPNSNSEEVKITDSTKMYIKYQPVHEYVEKIYFGPKAKGMELFQDFLNRENKEIPCVTSTNPLA